MDTPFPWPQANEVHIHCLPHATEAVHYIAPDEILRANRLIDPDKRTCFVAHRGLLRKILGRYLELQPEELHFVVGEHGKPYLATKDFSKNRLNFNLSHSGNLFILAVAADLDVGIDVEEQIDTSFSDMARLAFSPREQKELFELPDHLQQSAFYRCWTRKEAYLKACGLGFALPSNSFDVSLLPDTTTSLFTPNGPGRWYLQDITVPKAYSATLAVNAATPILRYID